MAKQLLKLLPKNLLSITSCLMSDLPSAKVHLVGGAVRDLLLERPTKDYDLVIGGIDIKNLENWLANHGQINLVGKTFGVYKWQPAGWAGEAIDVALPRTEHTTVGSGQYRDFAVQSDPYLPIEDDLLRRDFTINALGLDLSSGKIIDPSRGQADLETKKIRTVGKADIRLNEDLSRVFRGIRQACQLGFKIESQTLGIITQLMPKAANGKRNGEWLVPREIVARELLKSLTANPPYAVALLEKTGSLAELLPEVMNMAGVPQPQEFHSEGDVLEHTKLALGSFGTPEWREFFGEVQPSLNVVVATLLHDIGKPLTIKMPGKDKVSRIRTDGHDVAGAKLVPEICSRLRLMSYVDPVHGQANVETITWLVQSHLLLAHGSPEIFRPATIYRYFLKDSGRGLELQQVIFADMHATRPKYGRLLTPKLWELRDKINEVGTKLTAGKLRLVLSGNEIMSELGLQPGPRVGQLIKKLEEAQLTGTVKNKRQGLKYLRQL